MLTSLKGYDSILLTWQGMYYEISGKDIQWENLELKRGVADGEQNWTSEGVSILI